MKLYLLSGLGADHRVFSRLKLNAEVVHIPWEIPERDDKLEDYVLRLSSKIDISEEFYLAGLSFGGMCAQEMTKFVKPKKLVLISTAKSADEFPEFIKFAFKTGIYKVVPDAVYKKFAFGASRLMGVVGKNADVKFKTMVAGIDKRLFGWSIHQMAKWKGNVNFPYLHIHGTDDKVLPCKNIKNATLVKGGGHLMVLNRPTEVSKLINDYLKD